MGTFLALGITSVGIPIICYIVRDIFTVGGNTGDS